MTTPEHREMHQIVEELAESFAARDVDRFAVRMRRLREIYTDALELTHDARRTLTVLEPFEAQLAGRLGSGNAGPDFILRSGHTAGRGTREDILMVMESKPSQHWSPRDAWRALRTSGSEASLGSVQVMMLRLAKDDVIVKTGRGAYMLATPEVLTD